MYKSIKISKQAYDKIKKLSHQEKRSLITIVDIRFGVDRKKK